MHLNVLFLDTQLAIVCLSLISLLFHLIGTALLIIGFVSSLSSRTLYFYHSAGECLITSGRIELSRLNFMNLYLIVYYLYWSSCPYDWPVRIRASRSIPDGRTLPFIPVRLLLLHRHTTGDSHSLERHNSSSRRPSQRVDDLESKSRIRLVDSGHA